VRHRRAQESISQLDICTIAASFAARHAVERIRRRLLLDRLLHHAHVLKSDHVPIL
jgi:hypothetical protein